MLKKSSGKTAHGITAMGRVNPEERKATAVSRWWSVAHPCTRGRGLFTVDAGWVSEPVCNWRNVQVLSHCAYSEDGPSGLFTLKKPKSRWRIFPSSLKSVFRLQFVLCN